MNEVKWSEGELRTLFNNAIRKSMINLEYRQLLLTDPAAALAEFDNRPLPSRLKVVFTEHDVKTVSTPLPKPIATEELGEAQLEMIAGGVDFIGADNCTYTCIQ